MPGSVIHGKEEIKQFIESKKDIKTILDVGCGSGTYAKLLGKNYKYIGIEIWGPYIDQFGLNSLYRQIIIGDINWIDLKFLAADCCILGDVLEHLVKLDAKYLLNRILKKFKHVVVSLPVGEKDYYGKIHYGNRYEKHLSRWEFKEMKGLADWELSKRIKDIGIFCK